MTPALKLCFRGIYSASLDLGTVTTYFTFLTHMPIYCCKLAEHERTYCPYVRSQNPTEMT